MSTGRGKNIYFFFNGVKFSFRNRNKLKHFLTSLFKEERVEINSISYIFSTDRTVHDINRKFLNHDFFTDVITFILSNEKNPIIADVYVSIDRVRDNAVQQDESFQKELHRVIFHGALHACGYKDKSKPQATEMRRREDYYLSKYFE